jgi:AraC family transcriptional regulator
MQFSVRRSSRDRFWTGFVAIIYDTSPGSDVTRFSNTSLSMHIGAPALMRSACDGSVLQRIQVPGDIKIIPPGFSRLWEAESATAKLVVNMSPSLMRSAAEEMGANAERTLVSPQLHLRDPQIEHIVWALKAELESGGPRGRR